MKIITEDEIINRIVDKFPNQPFKIIEYKRVSQPITIQCLKCGDIKKYSSTNNFLNSPRKGICYCYNDNNKKTIHNRNKQEILKLIEENQKTFINFGYKESTKKYTITVQCNKCTQIYTKTWTDFLKKPSCPFCENKQKMNTQGFKTLLPLEYELLSDYKDQKTKILIRHNCGFIWKISPHSFLSHTGCPKCNKKRSMGERKIAQFLDNYQIPYSIEESFSWQTNKKRRYDFYLPEQKLVIEYMGEQHYKESSLFKVSLKEQQAIDREKKADALNNSFNYLAISYKDYCNIENILTEIISSTTILNGVDLSKSKE